MDSPRFEGRLANCTDVFREGTHNHGEARLPEQCDAVIHFDETRAGTPVGWQTGEAPETYPFEE